MDDISYQLDFVARSAWRLLALQDTNAASPSHGCFHLAYWRDKTSEFADARFQEAGAALGLLSLPRFDALREEGILPSATILRQAFASALGNWSRQQYPEGCFDEWYKGERGFAATEFTAIAYGLTRRYLKDDLSPDQMTVLDTTLRRAGLWLEFRHDKVKANHEAAAAAALALIWEATGDQRFRVAARAKIDHLLARQSAEGWFPEVGGMDLGYCSVLLDYVMLYVLVSGDTGPVAAMDRLMAFMLPHVQPDLTVAAEAGLCLNPYLSRLGIGLLSKQGNADAQSVVAAMRVRNAGQDGLLPILADDLRLCRWSYLPVLTDLLADGFLPAADSAAVDIMSHYPQGWTIRPSSAIAAWHDGPTHIFLSAAGGGCLRVYHNETLVVIDSGVDLSTADGETWVSQGYDSSRPILVDADKQGVGMAAPMGKAAFFYPSFLARLILRLGCSIPQVSYLLRALIDAYRLRRRTAINQSAAPLAVADAPFSFTRAVRVDAETIVIRDQVLAKSPIAPARLRVNLGHAVHDGATTYSFNGRLSIEKTLHRGPGPTLYIRHSHD